MMDSKVVNSVVLISANIEWQVVKDIFSDIQVESSPLGEWFLRKFEIHGQKKELIFLHGGWGKIAAAASTQFAIDTWQPELLINLGTCGGFEGKISKGTIVLAEKTLVYDIVERIKKQTKGSGIEYLVNVPKSGLNVKSEDIDLSEIFENPLYNSIDALKKSKQKQRRQKPFKRILQDVKECCPSAEVSGYKKKCNRFSSIYNLRQGYGPRRSKGMSAVSGITVSENIQAIKAVRKVNPIR